METLQPRNERGIVPYHPLRPSLRLLQVSVNYCVPYLVFSLQVSSISIHISSVSSVYIISRCFLSFCEAEKEAISTTVSLPEGLHKVIQSENTLSAAPKLGGKKMSFRRKLTPSTREENTE